MKSTQSILFLKGAIAATISAIAFCGLLIFFCIINIKVSTSLPFWFMEKGFGFCKMKRNSCLYNFEVIFD